MENSQLLVNVSKKGPYILKGDVKLVYDDGTGETKSGVVALCRCGGSSKKPFCDGTHTRNGFAG
jgi:CDGSH-type Zn-finger protein